MGGGGACIEGHTNACVWWGRLGIDSACGQLKIMFSVPVRAREYALARQVRLSRPASARSHPPHRRARSDVTDRLLSLLPLTTTRPVSVSHLYLLQIAVGSVSSSPSGHHAVQLRTDSEHRRTEPHHVRKCRSLGTPPRLTFQARLLHNPEDVNTGRYV